MTDEEMKAWLFERYANLPEYFREEIADGSFNLRDCLFRLLLMTEEQKDSAQDSRDKIEAELEALKLQSNRGNRNSPDIGQETGTKRKS